MLLYIDTFDTLLVTITADRDNTVPISCYNTTEDKHNTKYVAAVDGSTGVEKMKRNI